ARFKEDAQKSSLIRAERLSVALLNQHKALHSPGASFLMDFQDTSLCEIKDRTHHPAVLACQFGSKRRGKIGGGAGRGNDGAEIQIPGMSTAVGEKPQAAE